MGLIDEPLDAKPTVDPVSLDPDREDELLMWAESRFMERRRQLEEAREAAGQ